MVTPFTSQMQVVLENGETAMATVSNALQVSSFRPQGFSWP